MQLRRNPTCSEKEPVKHTVTQCLSHPIICYFLECAPPYQYTSTLYATESVRKHIVNHRVSMRTHCTPPSQYAYTLYTPNHCVSTQVHSEPPCQYASTFRTTVSVRKYIPNHCVSKNLPAYFFTINWLISTCAWVHSEPPHQYMSSSVDQPRSITLFD